MIDHDKFIQNVIILVFSLCVTGLMTWLGWITVVIFDHNKQIVRIEILENEVEKTKSK